MTPQRSPGILNPFVAEVVVIVRAAISGEIDASRNMRMTGINQVGMDLIGHDDQIVPDGEPPDRFQFGAAEEAIPSGFCGWQNSNTRARGQLAASNASRSITKYVPSSRR